MTTKLIENVLNGHLSKDDFGKVYFLNEEAAIDFAEAYHRTKCAESEPVGWLRFTSTNEVKFIKKYEFRLEGANPVFTKVPDLPVFLSPQPFDLEDKFKLAESKK